MAMFTMLLLGSALGWAADGAEGYLQDVEKWREKHEGELKAEDGWLSLAGLFWVRPGETFLGSDPACDIVLPQSAPGRMGTLSLDEQGNARWKVAQGVDARVSGKPFAGGPIRSDAGGTKADVVAVGDLRLILIKRGSRFAIRLKDKRSAQRTTFAGLKWYTVDPSWRIQGRFVAHPSPSKIVFETIVGENEVLPSSGLVEFVKDGKTYSLEAASEGNHLWFVFRDATSGRTTHPGARQLEADAPDASGAVVLDFNKAVNLPCAYTPYATCPLAPRQNRLSLAVTAGEQKYQPGPAPR